MKDTLSVKPKIIQLNEANDIYMELTMCILTNQVNLNDLKFTDNYINGIIENKERFIGIPLVVNREKLEQGDYLKLSHELNKKTGLLETDAIGSFVDFWSETDEEDTLKLMGTVRVLKRYPNVCKAMAELYESGDLEFSCEIFAYGYSETDEVTGIRSIKYEFEGIVNSLIGSCVVSYPAEVKSQASLLVAEALRKDIEEGEAMDNKPIVETFNKGKDVHTHGILETSALKAGDVSNQIYNLINPIDLKTNYRKYNYCIIDVYFDNSKEASDGYVILEEWDSYETLWWVSFSISNDIVSMEDKDIWVEGYKGFIPKGIKVDELLSKTPKEGEIELNEESTKEIEALKNQVKQLNDTIVNQQTVIAENSAEIENLEQYKIKVEESEKKETIAAITEKYSKLFSEDLMKSEEVIAAINELNEQVLNTIVVEHVSKELSSKGNRDQKEIVVAAGREVDLIPETVLQKYGIN